MTMQPLTRDELWSRLSEVGLVTGELPARSEAQAPWPMRAMLGIAGWVGALFLLGFAGIAFSFLFRSAGAAIPAGAACCFGAYAIFRAMPRNDFAAQFGFALSLAGQGLFLAGLFDLAGDRWSSNVALALAALEALLAFALPNYVHRVFATVAAIFSLMAAAVMMGVPSLATAVAACGVTFVWLDQIQMARQRSLWEPIGYGCAIALLHLDGSLMMGPQLWAMLLPDHATAASRFLRWVSPAIVGLLLVTTAWQLRARAGVDPDSRTGRFVLAAAILLALCGLGAPGISAAVLVLVLGFANESRVLMGLGLVAFLGYLSHFYYQLSSTLLVKSIVLCATGAVLLGLRWMIAAFLPSLPEEGSTNA